MASEQRHPSPLRTHREELDRQWRLVELKLEQQRIPTYSLVQISNSASREAYQCSVTDKLAGQPKEGLLEVVVGFSGDIVVLEVLLAVESDGLGFDLSLLDIDLITGQDNWDVLANTDQITWMLLV